jgi:hypothetical protein
MDSERKSQRLTARANAERAVHAGFATPACPQYGTDEKIFLLLHKCTTTLTSEQIIYILAALFQDVDQTRTLDGNTLKDILQTLLDRAAGIDGQLGDFKLHKLVDFGDCTYDFGNLCIRFNRKGDSAKDKICQDMVAINVWDEPFSELLR